ncbi:uncharacterized protein LOC119742996 [Patiria miniata]|uniref:Uncharacterized protein n=1 Tax=Patiria miniata TaxID=46514 RepID=A0A914BH54_PATMI|nr:uncharacterized protein LOC119742996 [Patiria miniata]
MDPGKASPVRVKDGMKSPTVIPQSTDTVSTIPADDVLSPVESPLDTALQQALGFSARQQAFEAQNIQASRTKMEGDDTEDSYPPTKFKKTRVAKVIEVQEQSPQTVGHTKYDASKISLVAELKQTDSFGKPLTAIPSSIEGRYQSINADDKSLMPIGTEDEDKPSVDNIDSGADRETGTKDSASSSLEDEDKEKESIVRALFAKRHQAPKDKKPQAAASDESRAAEGGVKRDSLVATVTVVTSLMKWQMKSKNKAGVKLQSMEKYKGHLEVIQRRSRQEHVDIPFPIRLSIRREVLPIIHNVVREYRLALGHDHKLTREAMAKEKQLRSELTGEEVSL